MNKRVLIVEDDALLSIIETRMIEHLGYTVIGSVNSGLKAIEKVQEEKPDILVMDIFLKGKLDGIDTMKEIRKESSVPVVYLSASDDPEHFEKAKAVNPVGFLSKPISRPKLAAMLEKACEEAS